MYDSNQAEIHIGYLVSKKNDKGEYYVGMKDKCPTLYRIDELAEILPLNAGSPSKYEVY